MRRAIQIERGLGLLSRSNIFSNIFHHSNSAEALAVGP